MAGREETKIAELEDTIIDLRGWIGRWIFIGICGCVLSGIVGHALGDPAIRIAKERESVRVCREICAPAAVQRWSYLVVRNRTTCQCHRPVAQ